MDNHRLSGRSNPPGRGVRLLEWVFVLCLILLGAFLTYVPKEKASLKFDSAAYAAQSVNIAKGMGNTMQMGDEEVPGFYPPGYPLLTAPFHWILGFDLQNGVPANFCMGLLTLLLVYLLGRRIMGPAAGAVALLLLLQSGAFRHAAQNVYSQMSSLLFVAIMTLFVFAGWRDGRRGWLLRLSAGLVCGLSVLVRSQNVVLSPGLALFALWAPPYEGASRWRAALPVWIGVGLSAAAITTYNMASFGSPMATGYTAWEFDLDKVFSLEYVFQPKYVQLGEPPQLVRCLFGLGMIYSWPTFLFIAAGSVTAWILRKSRPGLWMMFLLAAPTTLFLYLFLAVYFFRSPLYTMLTIPMIMVLAGGGLCLILQKLTQKIRPKGGASVWMPVILALLYLSPSLWESYFLGHDENQNPAKAMTAFKMADTLLEEDAILLGMANPLVAQYVFVRETHRRYFFLTRRESEQFRRLVRQVMGTDDIDPQAVVDYVAERLEEGRNVYFLEFPFQPSDAGFGEKCYKLLRKRFKLKQTAHPGIRRINVKKR